jgi:phosphoenolpyruvate carboxylase
VRGKLARTIEAMLALSGNEKLQQTNQILQWAMVLRNSYVDPLNVLQVRHPISDDRLSSG